MALRSNLVMPRLVTNDFGAEVAQKGSTISIPLPSDMTVTDVVPAAFAPDPQNIAPTTAQIPLSNWKESAFTLTEKEVAQIVAGVAPMQLSAAMQAMAFAINSSILNNYFYVGSTVGAAGTTPFASSVLIANTAGATLSNFYAPMTDRNIVLSPTGYANALSLSNFAFYLNAGDTDAVRRGEIKQKFGFDWAADQQIPTQTHGTLTGTVTVTGVNAANAADVMTSTIGLTTASGAAFNANVGDVLTFSGDTQTYSVVVSANIAASSTGTITIAPAKQVATAGGETVAMTGTHVVNLAFHKSAFAFASRPLADDNLGGRDPDLEHSVVDPVSGIAMRLIIRREFHRTRAAFDVLWGTAPVRPQLAVRIMG